LIFHKVGNVDVLFIYAQIIFDLLKLAGKLKRKSLCEISDVFQEYFVGNIF